jgi:hypothetical protein
MRQRRAQDSIAKESMAATTYPMNFSTRRTRCAYQNEAGRQPGRHARIWQAAFRWPRIEQSYIANSLVVRTGVNIATLTPTMMSLSLRRHLMGGSLAPTYTASRPKEDYMMRYLGVTGPSGCSTPHLRAQFDTHNSTPALQSLCLGSACLHYRRQLGKRMRCETKLNCFETDDTQECRTGRRHRK